MRRVLQASLLPLALLGASAVSAQCPCTHFGVSANPPTVAIPRKILLIPFDLSIFRVGPGSAERADDLVTGEKASIEEELRDGIGKEKKIEFVALPTLDPQTQAQVDEHIALFEQVAGAALRAQGSAAWSQRAAHFDYGIGNGLRFLKEMTGADAALFVGGRSSIPTGSSYALGAITLLAGVITVPQGRATATVGVVDLNTGNVIWLNQASAPNSLSNSTRVALKPYPDAQAEKK
jgi:hypothetical protein